jgi:hypothetical protein
VAEQCQKKQLTQVILNKIQSLIIWKCLEFQSKGTLYTKKQEDLKLNEKRTKDVTTEMTKIFEFWDKDFMHPW